MVLVALAAVLFAAAPASAQVDIQCPCDFNNDGDCLDVKSNGPPASRYDEPQYAIDNNLECMHLVGGDGFVTMARNRQAPDPHV